MWKALQSDLLDFVTTIQEDTTKTLSLVLGDDEVDAGIEEESLLGKWIADTKRSYETYSLPLKERRAKEFERFKRKFALTSHTKDIADILDEEPEVSRFYAELVPIQISPEEFWARLFFRLQLLTRTGNMNFEDEDEEEELTWEEADDPSGSIVERSAASHTLQSVNDDTGYLSQVLHKLSVAEEDNKKLRNILSSLTTRIAQLELDVKCKNDLIARFQSDQTEVPSSVPETPSHIVQPICVGTQDSGSEMSSEGLSFVNLSETNALTPYGTDEESSRHGPGGKATLIVTPNAKLEPAHKYDSKTNTKSSDVATEIDFPREDEEEEEEDEWS